MLTDLSGAAIGRVAAPADESLPPAAAVLPCDLADLAALVDRVLTLMAAEGGSRPEGSDALERIADIAFVLHERDVEASLCDALDAAVREMSKAETLRQASGQRAQEAVELLRELSRRVKEMLASSQSQRRTAPAAAANSAAPGEDDAAAAERLAEEAAEDAGPRDGLSATDMREDEEFAQAVAALAASLPSLADAVESSGDPQRQPADGAARSADHAPAVAPPAQGADDPGVPERNAASAESEIAADETVAIESAIAVFLSELSPLPAPAPEQSSIGPSSAREPSSDEIAIESAPREASGQPAAGEPVDAPQGPAPSAFTQPADHDLVDRAVEREPRSHSVCEADRQGPAHAPLPESRLLAGPDEDPGDLFEPIADAPRAAPVEPAIPVAAPAPSSDLAPHPGPPGVLYGESTGESAEDERAIVAGAEVAGSTEAPASAAAPALAATFEQNAKPVPASAPPAPPSSLPPYVLAGASAPRISRSAAIDPLAPVRALSEEEMIALFS